MHNERIRRVDNGLRASVIVLKPNDFRVREKFLEL